jgi:hypothetical protein
MVLGAHVDRADLKVCRLACAESLLNLGEILVALVDHLLVGHLLGHVGFNDLTAVQSRSLLQRPAICLQAQRASTLTLSHASI